jgi:hypothetical protein
MQFGVAGGGLTPAAHHHPAEPGHQEDATDTGF